MPYLPRVSSALIRAWKVDTTNDNMQARQLPKLWGSEASKNPQFRWPVYPSTSHKFIGSLLWVTYKECTWWWVYVKPATHLQGLDWCFRNFHNCFHLSKPTQEHRVGNADLRKGPRKSRNQRGTLMQASGNGWGLH
jgi:hypothetical protein